MGICEHSIGRLLVSHLTGSNCIIWPTIATDETPLRFPSVQWALTAAAYRPKFVQPQVSLMKLRHVYSVPDLATAAAALSAARQAGAEDDEISLIARSDIEIHSIPDARIDVTNDMVPAAIKGVAGGAATGLLAGLVAMVFPPLGVTIAGAALAGLAGAAVGGWSSALIGTTVENPVRREFEKEIEAGQILVVVDTPEERVAAVKAAIASSGGRAMPFESASALS